MSMSDVGFCAGCGAPRHGDTQFCGSCGAPAVEPDGGHHAGMPVGPPAAAPLGWVPAQPGPATTSRKSALLAPIAAGAVVVTALGIAGGWIVAHRNADTPAPADAQARSTSTAPAMPAPAPASGAGATPVTPAPATAAAVPSTQPLTDLVAGAEAVECSRTGSGPFAAVARGTAVTSCEFAVVVRNEYLRSGLDGADGTLEATSPVTGQTYTMRCVGHQPVRCEGGNRAQVLIYGGRLITR